MAESHNSTSTIKKIDISLQQLLNELGRSIYEIPKDGHCIPNAIKYYLCIEKKEEHTCEGLLKKLEVEMCKHREYYEDYITGNESIDDQLDAYIENNEFDHDIVDLVLPAIATMLEIKIILYKENQDAEIIEQTFVPIIHVDTRKTVYLLCRGNEHLHYDALILSREQLQYYKDEMMQLEQQTKRKMNQSNRILEECNSESRRFKKQMQELAMENGALKVRVDDAEQGASQAEQSRCFLDEELHSLKDEYVKEKEDLLQRLNDVEIQKVRLEHGRCSSEKHVMHLRELLMGKNNENQEHVRSKEDLYQRMDDAEKQRTKSEHDRCSLEKDVQHLRQLLQGKDIEMQEHNRVKEDLYQRLDDAEKQRTQSEHDWCSLETNLQHLRQLLQGKDIEIQEYGRVKEDLYQRLENAEKQRTQSEHDRCSLEKDVQHLRQLLQGKDIEMQEYGRVKEDFYQRLDDAEKQKTKLEHDRCSLEKDVQLLRHLHQGKDIDIQNLKTELLRQVDDAKKYKTQSESMAKEVLRLRQQLDEKEKTKQKPSKAQSAVFHIPMSKKDLQRQLVDAETHKTESEKERCLMMNKLQKLREQLIEKDKENQEHVRTKEDFCQRLDDAEKQRKQSQHEQCSLETDVRQLRHLLQEKDIEIIALTKYMDSLEPVSYTIPPSTKIKQMEHKRKAAEITHAKSIEELRHQAHELTGSHQSRAQHQDFSPHIRSGSLPVSSRKRLYYNKT